MCPLLRATPPHSWWKSPTMSGLGRPAGFKCLPQPAISFTQHTFVRIKCTVSQPADKPVLKIAWSIYDIANVRLRLHIGHLKTLNIEISHAAQKSSLTAVTIPTCQSTYIHKLTDIHYRWTSWFLHLLTKTIHGNSGPLPPRIQGTWSNLSIRVTTTLRTEKNPPLFQTKLQAICRTNAHLLIQILREHHVRKTNYSTNKVQKSYFVELPQSNFPHYTNSPSFPPLFPNLS